MPWYRIFASYGPGHQSSDEHFRWYEKTLDTPAAQEAWREIFEDGHYDWPVGGAELLAKLPQHIHDEKVNDFESSIDHAYKMLRVLRDTPTLPVICVRLEFTKTNKKTGYQARLMAEPNVLGPIKNTRDEAVDALLEKFRREGRKVRREKKGAIRYSRRRDYAVIIR